MEKILIVNASPRDPKSNSKKLAKLFGNCCKDCLYREVIRTDIDKLATDAQNCQHLVLIFPLYADSIPATLVTFLKKLQEKPSQNKLQISAVVNCGFLEYSQNETAIEQLKLFCLQNGYMFCCSLKIGGGEAILNTIFRISVKIAMRRFASSVTTGKCAEYSVTMPLSQRAFIRQAKKYWLKYGAKYGTTLQEMSSPLIEDK